MVPATNLVDNITECTTCYGDRFDIITPQLQWAINESRPDTIAPAVAQITAAPANANEVMITFIVPAHNSPLKEYVLKYDSLVPFNVNDSAADGVTSDYFWRGEDATIIPLTPCRDTGPDTLYASGLTIGKTYHFALKTYDSYTNLSRVSNDAASIPGTSGLPHTSTGPCSVLLGVKNKNGPSGISAFPSPANREVNFTWTDKTTQKVSIQIFNIMGQKIANIDTGGNPAAGGLSWNVEQVPTGIYLYQVTLISAEKTEHIIPMKQLTVIH